MEGRVAWVVVASSVVAADLTVLAVYDLEWSLARWLLTGALVPLGFTIALQIGSWYAESEGKKTFDRFINECEKRQNAVDAQREKQQSGDELAAGPPDNTTLEVVSLNCCLWPRGARNTVASAKKDMRCQAEHIPRLLKQYDLALCQEVFSWTFVSMCYWRKLIGKHLETTHSWAPEDLRVVKPYHTMSAGSWTLVKNTNNMTIVDAQYVPFKHEGRVMFDCVRPVGFQHTTIVLGNGGVLEVMNVHLLPQEGAFMDTEPFLDTIWHEMQQVIEVVDRLNENTKWIVGGDFNMDCERDKKIFDKFSQKLRECCERRQQKLYSFNPTKPTLNKDVTFVSAWDLTASVDHFYSNMKILSSEVMTEEKELSDHLPVRATFSLTD